MEPALVGLILDSSVAIAGERRGKTVRQILEQFKTGYGEIEIGLSVVDNRGVDARHIRASSARRRRLIF